MPETMVSSQELQNLVRNLEPTNFSYSMTVGQRRFMVYRAHIKNKPVIIVRSEDPSIFEYQFIPQHQEEPEIRRMLEDILQDQGL